MEIYKLNIDTTKPASQVVQMQQNSAGILSIDVTNDGKYIRNLSCAIYDGDTEITASKYGYKINVGSEPKHVRIEAKSQPYECSAYYILSAPAGTRTKTIWTDKVQLKAGTYHQDEFASLVRFGNTTGIVTILSPYNTDGSKINFSRIYIQPWNPVQQVFFQHADGSQFAPDELIIATEDAVIGKTEAYKTSHGGTATLSSTPYPAVGYYTNYQVDTLIKPAQSTSPYATIEYDPSNIEAGNISADNISADTFTLSGVTYVPTTLSVDGVAYSVLAAPIEQS